MIEIVYVVFDLIVFEFARYKLEKKDLIIRNLIARTAVMLRGIKQLWNIQDFQDCWVLYRCLLDRLFTLEHLASNDEFELFEEWSFYRQYKMQNEAFSDNKHRAEINPEIYEQYLENKKRFTNIAENPPEWKRPRARSIAKKMGLDFLYKYGYDYGSAYVHPIAYDGAQDFFIISGLEPAPYFPKQDQLLSNSILVGCMLVNYGMNYCDLVWHRLIQDFIEEVVKGLGSNDISYKITFKKIGKLGSDYVFSKPKQP
jgi:hypothetical protein